VWTTEEMGLIPDRGKYFSLFQSIQTGSRAHSASSGGIWPGSDADYLPPGLRMAELYFYSSMGLHSAVLTLAQGELAVTFVL
jgi:hypothetical protein